MRSSLPFSIYAYAGSTLPLIPGWPLHYSPTPPPGSNTSASPPLATAYALLWALGLQIDTKAAAAAVLPGHPSSVVIAAVKLVFDPESAPAYVALPDQLSTSQSDEIWQESLVRWGLTAVLNLSMRSMAMAVQSDENKAASILSKEGTLHRRPQYWTVPQARQLVENYCASSFGDSLFGGAIALLFNSFLAPLDVQLESLECLLDGRALHLLPPLNACPGPAKAYLDAPISVKQDLRASRDGYLKVLESPDAEKCIDSGSMVLSMVIHRLARMIFNASEVEIGDKLADTLALVNKSILGVETKDDSELDLRKRHALLCGILRRLKSPRLMPVLGMLLRWSCEEGAAVDAVPAARMEFVEAACDADGSEGLMHVVMQSLEA